MDTSLKSRTEWRISDHPVPYPEAVAQMEARAAAIADGRAGEIVWLLEHPPIYTAGTSANDADLIEARFPVHRTGRGGQFTYHGPGQRVGYVMLNLKNRKPDVRAFVRDLEQWLIDALAQFGVKGERREGRVGIWVARGARDEPAVGRAEEQEAALDAGPQDQRVEHLLKQRAQPIARRERAHDALELRDLRGVCTGRR